MNISHFRFILSNLKIFVGIVTPIFLYRTGEVATLVIGEAFPEDTGIFTCEATNKAGSATTSCKIVVKGKFIVLRCIGLKL